MSEPIKLSAEVTRLLCAAGVPSSLQGAGLVTRALEELTASMERHWPSAAASEWHAAAKQGHQQVTTFLKSGSPGGDLLVTAPRNSGTALSVIANWQPPLVLTEEVDRMYALFGRALVGAAAAPTPQPLVSSLAQGFRTLHLAFSGKGKRAAIWDELLNTDMLNLEAVKKAKESPAAGPAAEFLTAVTALLTTASMSPSLCVDSSFPLHPDEAPSGGRSPEPQDAAQTQGEDVDVDVDGDQSQKCELEPDVRSRLQRANWSSPAEKLGISHRDHLLTADLAQVTQNLATTVRRGTRRDQGFAVFAILQLVTGCTDEIAAKLEFSPRHSIWLDLEMRSWAWDFAVYRDSLGPPSGALREPEPIYIPWPALIGPLIQTGAASNPAPGNLADLICRITGEASLDLDEFRRFLIRCGNACHPAYRGRFARSLSNAYLDVTGSDMTAALATCFFAACAPSALAYFGPGTDMMLSRVAAVYSRLGLGAPAAAPLSGRIGCTKILEVEVLHECSRRLVREIDAARAKTISSSSKADLLENASEWLALSAAAFVAESAHRGTKVWRLTFGAVILHPHAMVVNDKEDGDRIRPRLIPKTPRMQAILAGCLECHEIVRSGCPPEAKTTVSPDDPLFVQWSDEGAGLVATALTTAVIARIIRRHFHSDVNFGRSQWVTYADAFGLDRWFVRLLTGHARDVSRLEGPFFDIAPLEACRQAQDRLQQVGEQIFGPSVPTNCSPPQPAFELSVDASAQDIRPFTDRVPDPRTLLTPLSSDTVVGWKVAEVLRQRLFAGQIDAGLDVLAFFNEVLMDHVVDVEIALAAVCRPARHIKLYGRCLGLTWNRPHFLHPTWIPLRPTTVRLIDLASEVGPLTPDVVRTRVAEALGRLDFVSFPADPNARINALMEVASAFRRLELPTTMNAQAHPLVPAPALSDLSLMRLSGVQLPPLRFSVNPKLRNSHREKADDIAYILRVVARAADTRLRHGETQKRARMCLDELAGAVVVWTPFGGWLLEITQDQLTQTYEDPRNGLKVSSWHTYLCSITTAAVDPHDDPREWDEHDWHEWIDRVDAGCRTAEQTKAPSPDADRPKRRAAARERLVCDRAKHALCAVVASVQRLQQHVPATVRERLQLTSASIIPYSSASATIILEADHPAIDNRLHRTHGDHPADLALLRFRTSLGRIVPVRSGDTSSTRSNCITPGNAVTFDHVGYNAHKSDAAVRSVPVSAVDAKSLRSCLADIERYFGPQPFACRTDGSPAAGLRDSRLALDCSRALKAVTGDAAAREHSVRGSTMQQISWPGWQSVASKLLAGELTSLGAAAWSASLDQDWLRTARAMAAAGHADLRAGFGSYFAGWPLVQAIRAAASLTGLAVGAQFVRQLEIDPAALRKARSRAAKQAARTEHTEETPIADDPVQPFNDLEWVTAQCLLRNLKQWELLASDTTASPKGRDNSAVKSPATVDPVVGEAAPPNAPEPVILSAQTVMYVTARALGLSRERAIERLDMRVGQALELERAIPNQMLVANARRRAQSLPSKRGAAADIETALSEFATSTVRWLLRLPGTEFHQLCEVLQSGLLPLDHIEFWRRLGPTVPQGVRVGVRIGKKYVKPEQISDYQDLEPAINLAVDKRIGAKTIASVYQDPGNMVESARMTAVVKVQALSLTQLRNLTSEENSK